MLHNTLKYAIIIIRGDFVKKNRTSYWNNRKRTEYDRKEVTFPKGKKQVYTDYADKSGKSLNGLINELLENEVKKDGNPEP